ncbi:TonB-dependent siderophore receptor [Pleurocapsales cyanobacterium LEGE 10410]|nr:TonB-dependent siderophore receptor [Pleurocapsales cyanobacterium LEGE 10410]
MKLLSVLLFAGVAGLIWVYPLEAETFLDGETRKQGVREKALVEKSPSPPVPDALADAPANPLGHIAQGITRVTGVEVIQTQEGLELILKTSAGSERLVPLILPEGNELVIDILDATLAFSIRNGVTQLNPAPGIRRVTVNKGDDNSVRVRITGENQTPSAEVVTGRDDLVLSVTPQDTTAEEPNEQIEVIATGEAEDEDDYYVPDASSTLRTDTPIRDTPSSVQVIPQQVIEDQGATSITEIVRNASGVNFSDASGGRDEDFIIRGFEAVRFRNGFRDDSASSRTEIELANIDRVEILKGPASILFGRAEPAGIVNLVTKQPLREPFYEIAFTAGSFDFYRPSLDFSAPLTENGNLAYRLNAAYENAGSFRDGVETERFFVAPTLSWQISPDTELTLEYSYLSDTRPVDRGIVVLSDDEVADIPFSSFLGDPDVREDFEENRTELYLDHRFNSSLSLRSLLRYTTAVEEGIGATSQIFGESEDDRNFPVFESTGYQFYETFTFQNDLIGKFNTGSVEHTVLFGLEYATEFDTFEGADRESGLIDIFNADAFEPLTGPFDIVFDSSEDSVDSFGIYLQDQIALLDNLQLVVGGRFDTFNSESENITDGEIAETEADAFSPRVGIVYQPIEPVSLYASYSRSFTPVSGTDVNNETFDPERGTGFEIGVKTEIIKNKLFSTLALYDTTLTNVTTEDPDNPNFEVQTGEQNSQGIELDVTGEILPGWNIFAGYAYTDAEVTEDNVIPVGNLLNNVPEHNFNLWTTYTLQRGSLSGLGFGAGVFYISERAGDLENSFFVDGYTRVDAAIFYEKDKYRAALNFKNLFDAEFIEGTRNRREVVPGAPFTVQGTVSVTF